MPDELLHLFEEARAVGLVLVRHELAGWRLMLSLLLRLRLASIPLRQQLSPNPSRLWSVRHSAVDQG